MTTATLPSANPKTEKQEPYVESAQPALYNVVGNFLRVTIMEGTPYLRLETTEKAEWIQANPEARAAVERGIEQAREGDLRELGDFVEYTDIEID